MSAHTETEVQQKVLATFNFEGQELTISFYGKGAFLNRLVACWNALLDAPTERLEEAVRLGITDVSLGNLFSTRLELQAQRDKLLAALEELRSCCFDRRDALSEFERLGDLYFREFGRLRPGKDDPMYDSNDPENIKQYEQWSKARYEQALDRVDAAIAEVKGGV